MLSGVIIVWTKTFLVVFLNTAVGVGARHLELGWQRNTAELAVANIHVIAEI